MQTIEYDESRWPVASIRYAAVVNEDEFEMLLQKQVRSLKRALAERQRICWLYDASLGYHASPRVRKLQARWMEEKAELFRLTCAGSAMVFTSALTRGVL